MTDERKQALIEKHRYINVEYEWWDCTYEDFTEEMKAKGITVQEMQFSGFCSQGDGASFTGYVSDEHMFLELHDLSEEFPMIALLRKHNGTFNILIERTSSRYVHENTVRVELSYCDEFRVVVASHSEVQDEVIRVWDELLNVEYGNVIERLDPIIRGYCRDLYKQLEEEYDYLTSDEAVWETLLANDMTEEENV